MKKRQSALLLLLKARDWPVATRIHELRAKPSCFAARTSLELGGLLSCTPCLHTRHPTPQAAIAMLSRAARPAYRAGAAVTLRYEALAMPPNNTRAS